MFVPPRSCGSAIEREPIPKRCSGDSQRAKRRSSRPERVRHPLLPGLPAARSQAVDGVKQIAVTKLNFEEGVVSPQLGSRARANTRFWEV